MQILNTLSAQAALFQHASVGIIIVNDKGEIHIANDYAQLIFGYTNEELKGKKIELLIPERYQERHTQHREKYTLDPRPRTMGIGMDLRAVKKDGAEFPVEISLSPFNENGIKYTIAFISDITIRKHQERLLVETSKELSKNLEELKRFNDEMKEFAYVSSHHLQEPLRKIQTFSHRLYQEETPRLSDNGKEYVKKIITSTETMRDKVNDFILFTRLDTKDQIRVPANLKLILNQVIGDLNVFIQLHRGHINMPTELPVIYADPLQMSKLFLNLVSNAMKFHKPGILPSLAITHRFIPSENIIEITFEDNGIGFDTKSAEDMFHLFQFSDSEGQGIGLALCRKICKLHGGNLTATSTPGVGSKFIATLATNQLPR